MEKYTYDVSLTIGMSGESFSILSNLEKDVFKEEMKQRYLPQSSFDMSTFEIPISPENPDDTATVCLRKDVTKLTVMQTVNEPEPEV